MVVLDRWLEIAIALLRIAVGVIFLWAGVEKLMAPAAFDATGFLQFGTTGTLGWPFISGTPAEGTVYNPTHDVWVGLSDSEAAMTGINVLVPFGQLGIGLSLSLGLFTRFGAAMGTLMMLVFFVAAWDFEFGIVNQHLTYALVTAFIGYLGAGNYFGLDRPLGESMPPTVRRWLLSGATRRCPPATSPPPLAASA